MIFKNQFIDSLLGKSAVDAAIRTLYNQSDDFPEVYQAYLSAIEKLHTVLGPEAKQEIRKYVAAIEQICASNLFYVGTQGFKMNYDHFVNPMTPNCTWPQIDYDDYIRIHIAESLPMHETARRFKEKFEKQLPEGLEDVTDAIISYETALECSGMKLAHYYGYLMGNELLPHCVPGYYPDLVLDIQYTQMLEEYFGQRIVKDQWEGCYKVKEWKIAPIPEENPQDTLTLREEIRRSSTI